MVVQSYYWKADSCVLLSNFSILRETQCSSNIYQMEAINSMLN